MKKLTVFKKKIHSNRNRIGMLWPVEQDKICYSLFHSFETQPGPTGRPGIWPTRGWNQAELKKIRKVMTRCDSANSGLEPGRVEKNRKSHDPV